MDVSGVVGLGHCLVEHSKKSALGIRADVICLGLGIIGAITLSIPLYGPLFGLPSPIYPMSDSMLMGLFLFFPVLPITVASFEIWKLRAHWYKTHIVQTAGFIWLLTAIIATPLMLGGARVATQELVMSWYGRDLHKLALDSAARISKGQRYCVMDHDGASRLEDLDARPIVRRAIDQRLEIGGSHGKRNAPTFRDLRWK